MFEAPDVESTVRNIEDLLEELREADPRLRKKTEEIIRLLMQLYGSGFARVMEILREGPAGQSVQERFADDKLVSSLLLLHGLHPVAAETRIREALTRVERKLDGASLEVAGISDELVRVRVHLNGGSAPSATIAGLIERAIAESAPDIGAVEIEGLPQPAVALVQIAPAAAS